MAQTSATTATTIAGDGRTLNIFISVSLLSGGGRVVDAPTRPLEFLAPLPSRCRRTLSSWRLLRRPRAARDRRPRRAAPAPRRVGEPDLDQPARAVRVVVDPLGRIGESLVDRGDLARERCDHVGDGLDRLDLGVGGRPWRSRSPTSGGSKKTTSPSASCAYQVIPRVGLDRPRSGPSRARGGSGGRRGRSRRPTLIPLRSGRTAAWTLCAPGARFPRTSISTSVPGSTGRCARRPSRSRGRGRVRASRW